MQKGMFRMFKITKKVDFWTKFSNEYQCNFLEKWTLKYQKNILGFLVLNQFLISAIPPINAIAWEPKICTIWGIHAARSD